MAQHVSVANATIIPSLRYRDAVGALEWLQRAFGFESHLVTPGPNGTILHAELRLGHAFIMLGSLKEIGVGMTDDRRSSDITQGIYVALDDVDMHYEQACMTGAEVVQPLRNTEYGSREYSVRDPEGHYWSFGTYRPT